MNGTGTRYKNTKFTGSIIEVKGILFITFLFFATSNLFAHEYFFAYAEVEYNEITLKLEGTIDAEGHDLENAVGINKKEGLENVVEGSASFLKIEEYINKHLIFSNENGNSQLKLIGIEIDLNDKVHLYFESEKIELTESVSVHFDLLMETFDEQQNKLTFILREQATTYSFLQHKKTQTIELK